MTFKVDSYRVDGKVAIVTGAGGRGHSIGRADAMALAEAGASVVVADLRGEGAASVAEEIVAAGGKAHAVQVDIADAVSVAAMAAAAKSKFGGVDILVNNAALMTELSYEPLLTTPLEKWNRTLDVNLTGALNCIQAVAPMMIERGGGKIVNQSSGGAYPPKTLYGIAKLALVGLTTAMAYELGPKGINVNAIAPATPIQMPARRLRRRARVSARCSRTPSPCAFRANRMNWSALSFSFARRLGTGSPARL